MRDGKYCTPHGVHGHTIISVWNEWSFRRSTITLNEMQRNAGENW